MTNTAKNVLNFPSTPTSSPMSQTALSISTLPVAANLRTGTELSGRGLETLRGLLKDEKRPTSHEINQQILASLKLDLGSQLVIKTHTNSDFDAVGMDVSITAEVPDRWVAALEHFAKPASGQKVAMEVTRLRTLTAKRAEGEFDLELSIGAITEELCEYPEDIVVTVCRNWARANKWFPTLSELISACDALFDERKKFLRAAKATKPLQSITRSEDVPNPSDEEKQRVSDMLAEFRKTHGFTPEIEAVP